MIRLSITAWLITMWQLEAIGCHSLAHVKRMELEDEDAWRMSLGMTSVFS